jgi:putative transposase
MDRLTALLEEARRVALDRLRLIQPHIEQDQSLSSIAQTAAISYRTAQRWLTQYRRFGLAALARKQREDRGERRAVSEKLKEIIEGLALQKPPLPIAAVYRQWMEQMLYEPEPEADARRAKALPLIAQDKTRVIQHLLSGLDLPADEIVRRRFFWEE